MALTRYIYVVGPHERLVKVGVALSVERRLQNLQAGHPDELKVFHRVGVPEAVALEVERAAHLALNQYHRYGEWFDVDAAVAVETIRILLEPQQEVIEPEPEPESRVVVIGSSRYRGVERRTHRTWSATIYVAKMKVPLGNYWSEIEAADAYDKAAVQFFGKKAITNQSLGLLEQAAA